jgi:hypothetical protein
MSLCGEAALRSPKFFRRYNPIAFRTELPLEMNGQVDWRAAMVTNQECVKQNVRRPVDIHGCGELAGLEWFLEDVAPPYFFVYRWIDNMNSKEIEKIFEEITGDVTRYLERYGF